MNHPEQLLLDIRLTDAYSFENYLGERNEEAATSLREAVESLQDTPTDRHRPVYLWGQSATGKTHLLQAACRHANALGLPAVYLPLGSEGLANPEVLDGLEDLSLVCIDDLQQVAGKRAWEEAVLGLYESMAGTGVLVISSTQAPGQTGLVLPDLVSRLSLGLVYGLGGLQEAQRLEVVRSRAQFRGLELPEDVQRYLERHYSRRLDSLLLLLDRLDHASLARQRRITVPFVRELLGPDSGNG